MWAPYCINLCDLLQAQPKFEGDETKTAICPRAAKEDVQCSRVIHAEESDDMQLTLAQAKHLISCRISLLLLKDVTLGDCLLRSSLQSIVMQYNKD
jgi:hypothetical protein